MFMPEYVTCRVNKLVSTCFNFNPHIKNTFNRESSVVNVDADSRCDGALQEAAARARGEKPPLQK